MDKIEKALSKLTLEERELLGLITKPEVKKNHKLKILYMIGDADGHTDEKVNVSLDNPFLNIITGALDKLEVCNGYIGISLNIWEYGENYKKGNISKMEYDLLCLVSGYSYKREVAVNFLNEYGFEDSKMNHDYLNEFSGLMFDDTEYSFLTYKGYKLT